MSEFDLNDIGNIYQEKIYDDVKNNPLYKKGMLVIVHSDFNVPKKLGRVIRQVWDSFFLAHVYEVELKTGYVLVYHEQRLERFIGRNLKVIK